MNLETIETDRLFLRRLTDEDYAGIFSKRTEDEIMDLLQLGDVKELALERQKVEKGISTFNKRMLVFQLLHKQTSVKIGSCGYHTWYTDHDRAEIGYGLIQEERNKGYMSEALKAILEYGFREMNLNRIEAFIGSANLPSQRLVERFGFRKEGCLREHYLHNDVLEDSLVYGLLKSDLNPAP